MIYRVTLILNPIKVYLMCCFTVQAVLLFSLLAALRSLLFFFWTCLSFMFMLPCSIIFFIALSFSLASWTLWYFFLTPCLALHYMIQTDLYILLCMCFCTNHPLIPNQLLQCRFYRAHTHTHRQHCPFLCLINPVVHCCFLFWGHKPVTLAEMKGLPCAPNKACTFGPSHCLLWGFNKHTCRPSGAVQDRREQRGETREWLQVWI